MVYVDVMLAWIPSAPLDIQHGFVEFKGCPLFTINHPEHHHTQHSFMTNKERQDLVEWVFDRLQISAVDAKTIRKKDHVQGTYSVM